MARSVPRLNYRVFAVFLIVGLPALAIAAVIALGTGQARLRDSYGSHLSEIAEQTAAVVDAYLFRRIVDATILTRVTEVRAAAATASRESVDMTRVQALDREWQRSGRAPPGAAGLLATPASAFLADVVTHDPIYREILLTDVHGRLVAASNVTTDYYQADEEWWRDAYADGARGRVSVSDVQWDQSARAFAVEMALPVAEPSSDRLAGILKVIADIREMGAVIGGVQPGSTGETTLVREDGSIVFSRRRLDPSARFFAADLLQERYRAVRQGDPNYRVHFSARAPDGADRLVAVAPTQLSASYPHIGWLVAVSQAESELLEPVRAQVWSLIVVLALTLVAILGLAISFSMRLRTHRPESDMHLVEHAEIPKMEESV